MKCVAHKSLLICFSFCAQIMQVIHAVEWSSIHQYTDCSANLKSSLLLTTWASCVHCVSRGACSAFLFWTKYKQLQLEIIWACVQSTSVNLTLTGWRNWSSYPAGRIKQEAEKMLKDTAESSAVCAPILSLPPNRICTHFLSVQSRKQMQKWQ